MKCILFAGVVAAFFVFGEALHCYHTAGIDKPFNKNDLSIPCPVKPDTCIKSTVALKNGTTLVIRTCLSNMLQLPSEFQNVIAKFPVDPKAIAGDNHHICDTDNCNGVCDTDNCNGGRSIIAVFSIILASLFISMFVNH